MRKIPVLEIFGPTVQGEGAVIGRKTMFVRTAGCDYRCAWCDSAFTWDGSAKDQIRLLTPEETWSELVRLAGRSCDHVTISGGNPALLPQIADLAALLKKEGVQTALETQGSRWQDWFYDIDDLTISPKPPSSGMDTDFEQLTAIIGQLKKREKAVSLKVVIFDEQDLSFAKKVHELYPEVPFFLQTGNGQLSEQDSSALLPYLVNRYEWLIDQVMSDADWKNVRVLPQLHTFVWGNKQGV
ncbi:7-carboxy-7-deazaguanine synthase QueE [Bacillus thermotolerans]|uniref:7-carboxy-7-deazaguanine synthase n=1 Tax=Bacillus thermotolerans TaxID=1221996 RepID=A0A0F5I983_BACTR|nr:7-carboxy-7-deazaguanine synthase QueE [Bacillus thermotolerans]KKB42008.1 Queuosine Biosynthesis QueE Radical SAM [Bacillus thermotolerans]